MQAVIALCHFCEKHGPRVLLVCQPVGVGCEEGPSTAGQPPEDENRCAACTSIQEPITTYDDEMQVRYITTQVPIDRPVNERVRYSCMRSLSIEMGTPQKDPDKTFTKAMDRLSLNDGGGADRDGIVLFADSQFGCTLSLAFKLRDSKARGFLRSYSLIAVGSEPMYILNNYDFLVNTMTIMKSRLQELAMAKYRLEMDESNDLLRPENASRANIMPNSIFKKAKNEINPLRDLRTIVSDDSIWSNMHRQMMWTLRTQSLRCSEDMLEGMPTQDMLVLRELPEKKVGELELRNENQYEVTLRQLDNLKVIAKCTDRYQLDILLYHIITGGQVVAQGERYATRAFLLALSNLLPIGCLKIRHYSDRYEHSYKYNLLGVPVGTRIPREAEDALVCVLKGEVDDSSPVISLIDVILSFRRLPSRLPSSRPALLIRFAQLLLDEEVSENVLESTIRSAREIWLAKAKRMYQLTHGSAPRDTLSILRTLHVHEEDRPVLVYWQSGLAQLCLQRVAADFCRSA